MTDRQFARKIPLEAAPVALAVRRTKTDPHKIVKKLQDEVAAWLKERRSAR